SNLPTCPSCSIMPSAYSVRAVRPGLSRCSGRTWVRRCMRVALNQQKNGLFAVTCRLMKSTAASEVSSSIVSMRFRVSGPVSSMVLLADPSPTWLLSGVVGLRSLAAQDAARSELLPEFRVSWIVEELGLFFCVEMIQVAEEFVEAVHRGQITVQIAEMILPELSRGVAERLERLGDGNVAVLQADRRAWDADF